MTSHVADKYDVIVVGGSLAGCTAALLFSRYGLRVLIVEKEASPEHFKIHCTHFILPSAVPTLRRIGITDQLESAGAVRSNHHLWSPWGWVKKEEDSQSFPSYGLNVTRKVMDPLIRKKVNSELNVDIVHGCKVNELVMTEGRVSGIRFVDQDKKMVLVNANIVVGADGRNSKTAKIAGLHPEKMPNGRSYYFTYYNNLPTDHRYVKMWLADPDVAYVFPNAQGRSLVCCAIAKDKHQYFKRNLQHNIESFFSQLPGAPDFSQATRVEDIHAIYDLPTYYHRHSLPGLALIGDAACCTDPISGAGCSWAFESAEWLVNATAPALVEGTQIEEGLAAYREKHFERLYYYAKTIAYFSSGRKLNWLEKNIFSIAPHNRAMSAFINRTLDGEPSTSLPMGSIIGVVRDMIFNRSKKDQADYNWLPLNSDDAGDNVDPLGVV